ncbi:MAG: proline dehydrogenase family protein [Gemmatimonadota bacterium]
MAILRHVFLKASRSAWLAERLGRRGFTRRAVRRFMPGERLEDALAAAAELRAAGLSTVLTLLGENVTDTAEAERIQAHYHEALSGLAASNSGGHISVKLTHLGLDVDRRLAESSVHSLAERAAELGSFLWIDMEGSEHTDVTLDIYRMVRSAQVGVGVCLQAYLHRTEGDLRSLLPLEPAIRLVKGAYQEPSNIAIRRKREVDRNYVRLAELLLEACREQGIRPAFATHDGRMIHEIRRTAEGMGIRSDAFEFQMLYGIRREEQMRLAAEGFPMRVLISYGDGWFPWYMRRLAERPANVWFVVRSLVAR